MCGHFVYMHTVYCTTHLALWGLWPQLVGALNGWTLVGYGKENMGDISLVSVCVSDLDVQVLQEEMDMWIELW